MAIIMELALWPRIPDSIYIIKLLEDFKWFDYIHLKISPSVFVLDLEFNWVYVYPVFSHQKRTKSQLWISGLFPSAYWCGQALVDISFFIFLLLSMYLIFYIANITVINITSRIVFGLVSNTLCRQCLIK